MLFPLLCFLLIYSSVLGQCPSGFTEISGTWCYQIYQPHYLFEEAKTKCASLATGGKLADVETREEYLALLNWMDPGEVAPG